METIEQQIGALQVIVAQQQVSGKRQRFAIIALAGIIVAGGFIAAVQMRRLQIETWHWILSKLLPRKYGDRMGLDHQGDGFEFDGRYRRSRIIRVSRTKAAEDRVRKYFRIPHQRI